MNINIKHYQLLLYVSDYFHYFLESCLFLIHLQKMKQSLLVCAMEGVNIVVGIFFFMIIAMKAKFKLRIDYCIYALKFNIPLIPHYMSMYILASSDRIMITKMIDTTSTAIYSVAYTVASVIQILWTSIEASLSPWIYERLDVQDEESVRKTSGQIILTFAVFCLRMYIICSGNNDNTGS